MKRIVQLALLDTQNDFLTFNRDMICILEDEVPECISTREFIHKWLTDTFQLLTDNSKLDLIKLHDDSNDHEIYTYVYKLDKSDLEKICEQFDIPIVLHNHVEMFNGALLLHDMKDYLKGYLKLRELEINGK